MCTPCSVELIRSLDNEPPVDHFGDEVVPTAASISKLGFGPKPVTLDEWHRALGLYKCLSCGVLLLNGDKCVWQGRNRSCEKCFWGEDSGDTAGQTAATSEEDRLS